MKRTLPIVIAVVLVIASGLVHGYWTQRWHTSQAVAEAVEKLPTVPMEIGDWKGEPMKDPGGNAGLAGQLFRRYVNRKTGDQVAVMLVCGRPGPVCIHTPDVCYAAGGYAVGTPATFALSKDADAAKFFTADAVRDRATDQTRLRIFWAWYADRRWQAPPSPRMAFPHEPVLYKFYVIREMTTPTDLDLDPCAEFLRQFLPAMQPSLVNSAG